VRIGIESGEVVADESDSTFATGEAVNLAARLEQQAGPNEIVIGPTAARLVRDLVELEPLEPLELRGWREPVAASRVVRAREYGRPMRSLSAPLVGRESELELLENTFVRTVRDARATLVTLYGEAGDGKSRLAREFVDGLERATVLRGRCLPYGEGVTYWSIAEMVKASAGISPLGFAPRRCSFSASLGRSCSTSARPGAVAGSVPPRSSSRRCPTTKPPTSSGSSQPRRMCRSTSTPSWRRRRSTRCSSRRRSAPLRSSPRAGRSGSRTRCRR